MPPPAENSAMSTPSNDFSVTSDDDLCPEVDGLAERALASA
jgi:hypothetical protein